MADRPYPLVVADAADRADVAVADVLAGLVLAVGDDAGWTKRDRVRCVEILGATTATLRPWRPPDPPRDAGPEVLGQVHQALLSRAERRAAGVFYTPAAVARGLVERALEATTLDRPTVGDPAVGGGIFLLAAADALVERAPDLDPGGLVAERLWGIDIDPIAVAVTTVALDWWARRRGATEVSELVGLRCGNGLLDDDAWPLAGAQVVVGNPPFRSQLGTETARARPDAERLVARFGAAAKGYVDDAALFLLASVSRAVPGGSVVLVLPESVLVAAGAAAVREEVETRGQLAGLWLGGREVAFGANVRVCAPIVAVDVDADRRDGSATIECWHGPDVTHLAVQAPALRHEAGRVSWASPRAAAHGVPGLPAAFGPGTVADLAHATAGFRDEYYGLIPHLREAREEETATEPIRAGEERVWAPLVTSGALGPGVSSWGVRPSRVGRKVWRAPVVDLAALRADAPKVGRWVDQRLRPKLLLATQSRIVEATVDEHGGWIPAVPVVSIEPHPDHADELWHLAAVLNSPVATIWALRTYGGAALSPDAIRLAARQVVKLPLPVRCRAWDAAADLQRAAARARDEATWHAALAQSGADVVDAYGDDPNGVSVAWWIARLPPWPGVL